MLAGSTAYAIADTEGMDNKVSDAKGFYFVFVGAPIFGNLIDIIPSITVVDALYYSQVLDGMLIPVLIAITLLISNNKAIMGKYTTSRFTNFFAIFAMLATAGLSAVMFFQLWKGAL